LKRTLGQRAADWVTEFSGSWPFILWSTLLGAIWIVVNVTRLVVFDPYPFLFLNWVLTVISTLQSPLIMLSNNRQNDRDRENVQEILAKLDEVLKKSADFNCAHQETGVT
jgi:uncharacterized membrane protein